MFEKAILRDWPKLQESWLALNYNDQFEVRESFNTFNEFFEGFGDLMFDGDKEQVEKALLRLKVDSLLPTVVLKLDESRLVFFVERKRGLIALNLQIQPP